MKKRKLVSLVNEQRAPAGLIIQCAVLRLRSRMKTELEGRQLSWKNMTGGETHDGEQRGGGGCKCGDLLHGFIYQ